MDIAVLNVVMQARPFALTGGKVHGVTARAGHAG